MMMGLGEFKALSPDLSIDFVYGPGNVAADAVSRQYMGVLTGLAAQLGVQLDSVDVGASAWAFLEHTTLEFERVTALGLGEI